jgi:hypothetical protein
MIKSCCDEYCSTHGCNQGRNCPVRVAKVGKKLHGPDPLPSSIWRYQLKKLGYWMLISILGMLWIAFLVACAVYA